MKKSTIILAIAALFVAMPSKANPDNSFKFGARLQGNVVVNNVKELKGTDLTKGESFSGFSLGATLNTPSILGFSLNLSALYDWSQQIVEEKCIDQNYIDLPLYLRWTFGFTNLNVFVQAGYEFDINLKGAEGWSLKNQSGEKIGDFIANKTRQGANVGAGVTLFKHLELGLNYHWSFGDESKFEDMEKNIKNIKLGSQQLQLSAAYYF